MEQWTVVQLRAELKKRGLPTQGLKAQLIQRLTEANDNRDNSSSESDQSESESEEESPVKVDRRKSVAPPSPKERSRRVSKRELDNEVIELQQSSSPDTKKQRRKTLVLSAPTSANVSMSFDPTSTSGFDDAIQELNTKYEMARKSEERLRFELEQKGEQLLRTREEVTREVAIHFDKEKKRLDKAISHLEVELEQVKFKLSISQEECDKAKFEAQHERNKYLQEKAKHDKFRKDYEQEKEQHLRHWKKELDEHYKAEREETMKKLVSLKEFAKVEKQLQEERKINKELRSELDQLKEEHENELSNIMDQENEEREKLDEDIVLLQSEKIKLEEAKRQTKAREDALAREKKDIECFVQELEKFKGLWEANQELQQRCDELEIAKEKADAKLQSTVQEYETKLKMVTLRAEKAIKEAKSKQDIEVAEEEDFPVKSRLSMISTANRRQSVAVGTKENSSPNKKSNEVSPKRKARHSMMPSTNTTKASSSRIPVKRGSSLLPDEIKKGVSSMYN